MRMLGGIDFGTPLQPSHHLYIVSIHSVSIYSLSIAVDGYGRHVPAVVDVFIQLPLQQLEELGHREGIIYWAFRMALSPHAPSRRHRPGQACIFSLSATSFGIAKALQ
jgi:hypothetical protein